MNYNFLFLIKLKTILQCFILNLTLLTQSMNVQNKVFLQRLFRIVKQKE